MKFKGKVITVFGVFVGCKLLYHEKRAKLKSPSNQILAPQKHSKNAIVVGAGVAGVSTAYELGKRGYNVMVLDASNSVASECSACPAGSISEAVSMFDRNSWISVLKSWSPFSSMEDKFFQINWSRTLTDPHFIRWILYFSYYSLIKSQAQDINRLQMQKFTYYAIDRLKETMVKHEIGTECGLNDQGILYTSHDKRDTSYVNSKEDEQNKSCKHLSQKEMIELEPSISQWDDIPLTGDLYSGPNWLSANSEVFTQRLAKYCEKNLGVSFQFDTRVEGFEMDMSPGIEENGLKKIKRIYTNKGYIEVDDKTEVVVSVGSWTPRILWNCGYFVPIYPMKGYSVSFNLSEKPIEELRSPSPDVNIPTRMIIDNKMYISRLGQNIRVTSIGEFSGWDTTPDEIINREFREKGRKHVTKMIENFDKTPTRCGLRPQSADSVILVGRIDGIKNLSVNVGPGQTGWKLSIGAADVIGAVLDDNTDGYAFDIEKLSPKNKIVYAPIWSYLSRLRWE